MRRTPTVTLHPEGTKESTTLTVPRAAFDLLIRILGHKANGKMVMLLPLHADLLKVSQPFVVSLLEELTPYPTHFVEFTKLCDDWFQHLQQRRADGIDVVARWKRNQIGR